MRIAFIVHDYHKTGGHSRYVAELADRFAREHEVHIFANRIDGDRDPRIKFHYVPALRFSALATILTFILPATLRSYKEFDIVHAQGLCGLHQNVVTAHMCQAAWSIAQSRHMGLLTGKQKIFKLLVEPLEKRIFQTKATNAVIAVSRRVKGDLGTYYGRVDNVTVIHHGVDLMTFHPDNRYRWRVLMRQELGLGNDKFVALYVGDLTKGAIPAIEALAHVDTMRLVCVSASDTTPYRLFAEKMGVLERVIFLPKTPTIERYYAAVDVFVLPSFYDTFGMVVSEAMATGLPVIVSGECGASELIEHEVSGVVIEQAWDAEILAGWLERLRVDVMFRDKMGQEARKKIEHFTWDDTAAETMRVYQKVLASSKK